MWVPDTSVVTVDDIDDGPAVYNWAYVDDSGFIVETDDGTDEYKWKFNKDGVLTLPNDMTIDASVSFGIVTIGGTSTYISIDNGGAPPALTIATNQGENAWQFGYDGALTLPGGGIIEESQSIALTITVIPGTGSNSSGNLGHGVDQDPAGQWSDNVTYPLGTLCELSLVGATGDWQNYNGVTLYTSNNNGTNIVLCTDRALVQTINVTTGTFSSGTLRLLNNNVGIQSGANTWTFGATGELTLPQGSVISETTTTTVITPPGALAGQGLAIRSTTGGGLQSVNTFTPGGTVIVTFVDNGSYFATGGYINPGSESNTWTYTITGISQADLGSPLTGSFLGENWTSPGNPTNPITFNIPAQSQGTGFTITLDKVITDPPYRLTGVPLDGNGRNSLTIGSVTADPEISHVHLISADPSTVDLYLGDDDQYVKIEKNGGDVVIGTDANTNRWTFGTDGDLTLPGQLLFPEGTTFYNNGISVSSGTQYGTNVQGNTAGINQYWFADGTMPTRKWAAVRVNSPENASTGSVVVSTGAFNSRNNWIFAHDGSTVLPENTLKGYCFTATNAVGNYIPQAGAFYYTDNPILRSIATIGGAWYIKGPGLVGWKQITGVQDNGDNLIIRIGNGLGPMPDGSEFHSGNYLPNSPDLVYTISQYLELDVKAADKTWKFKEDGSVTFPNNTVQTTAYKSTSGSWTLATGSNTVSITVPLNGNYQMWVNGNIPNGLVEWNATVNVSNPNVPAIGTQYAWYYATGNALVLTAIPNQIVGTAGVISSSTSYAGTTSNVFSFGIRNNSTSTQTVNWGYTTL
jgi:hypothetical protein